MSKASQIFAAARDTLIFPGAGTAPDLFLWEHSERVMRLATSLALWPEISRHSPDPEAVFVAALFHDAGWVAQVRQGAIGPGQILARPTSDVQRELGVQLMQERVGELLSSDSLQLAGATIRECNNRFTELVEAQLVSEAENLDEIGVLSILRQYRQHQLEGRPLEQLLTHWTRQLEYHYWDARINDFLRLEISRTIARQRLASVEAFMAALARDRDAADVTDLLKSHGVDPTQVYSERS